MLSGLTPYLLAAGAALVAILAAFMRGRTSGAAKERAKQDRDRLAAIETANEVQNDVGAMPPSEARKELGTWWR